MTRITHTPRKAEPMSRTPRLLAAGTLAAALLAGGIAAPADAAARHTVTLVATATTPAIVTAAGNGIIVQKEDRTSYRRTFTKKAFTYYSVSIFTSDGGTVTCKILVDGKVKRSKKATGDFASVDCSL